LGGDGLGGLALAFGLAMVAMLVGGLAVAYLFGRALARRWHLSPGQGRLLGVASGAAGLLIGLAVVTATFFESTWAPPPELRIVVPDGFAQNWVLLLEDPKSGQDLDWQGSTAPFSGLRADVVVPAGGIVRVKGFGAMAGRADTRVVWSDGAPINGAGGGPAPAGIDAVSYMAFARASSDPAAMPEHLPEDLAAYVKAREGR
jgi:hypothetical protein